MTALIIFNESPYGIQRSTTLELVERSVTAQQVSVL